MNFVLYEPYELVKLITISGLDGSGKSTQIEMLKSELERQGSKVFYFHAVAFSLAQKLCEFKKKYCLICKIRGACKIGDNSSKSVTKANAAQIFLRKIFLRIDIWRFSLLRSKLHSKGFDYILSDRYFYDTVVNIEFLSGLAAKVLAAKPLKPDTAIYLRTSPDAIMSRERVPDQGLVYLEKKKRLYDAKTEKWNWKVIDGNQDKQVIFEEIKNLL